MAKEARERRPAEGGVSLRVELPPVAEGAEQYTNYVRGRQVEMRWLEKHRGKLADQYAGQWVVLQGREVVSYGRDAAAALSEARVKGIRIPFLVRIPSKGEGPLALEANYV